MIIPATAKSAALWDMCSVMSFARAGGVDQSAKLYFSQSKTRDDVYLVLP